jgi:hypothetical protein
MTEAENVYMAELSRAMGYRSQTSVTALVRKGHLPPTSVATLVRGKRHKGWPRGRLIAAMAERRKALSGVAHGHFAGVHARMGLALAALTPGHPAEAARPIERPPAAEAATAHPRGELAAGRRAREAAFRR